MFLKGETMNFGTNKEKGNSGLGMAIYRVLSKSYKVNIAKRIRM